MSTLIIYIGQQGKVEVIRAMVYVAHVRNEAVDHILLCGPSGSGRKTLAIALADGMHANIKDTSSKSILSGSELASILPVLEPADVLVITEFERQ